jgi:glutathione S-transferase
VAHARVDTLRSENGLDEAMAIFESGAAAGYLDAAHDDVPLPDGHLEAFRAIVRESLAERAGAAGKLALAFRRVFVVATRPT